MRLFAGRRAGGDLVDVQTYAARWAVQAWRIATSWHAINAGSDAHTHPFDAVAADKVIQIARWFAQEQMLILGLLRSERRNQHDDCHFAGPIGKVASVQEADGVAFQVGLLLQECFQL
jgi:Protein of unknown function (DUF3987)